MKFPWKCGINRLRIPHSLSEGGTHAMPYPIRKKFRGISSGKIDFDAQGFLDSAGVSRTVKEFQKDDVVFSQGDAAVSVLYIQKGGIRLSVVNESGKEAVIALLGPGDFFGEGCLAAQPLRIGNAVAISGST